MTADYKKEFKDLIATVIVENASDLHLSEDREPIIRVSSFLIPLVKHPLLSRQDIKAILDELLDSAKKEFKNLRENFIVKNFTYCYPVQQRGVKYLSLDNLIGDCGEYSSLFVTMCRILKIPARNNTGFVIFPKQKKINEHGWANIYLKPYGWLDFDTQYASLEKNASPYFGRRNDYRISFTNGFNIPLKPSIPKDFKINYWNEHGMPLTHTAAQTLQPIIFASQKEIEFKDSLELLS